MDKLGGVRLSLQLQTSPLDRPGIPQGDGTYNADLSLLDALAGDIGRYMNEIEALLDEQLNALKSTDWTGQSKERAVAGVSRFTSAAKSKTSEARTNMTKYITEQVNVLRNA